MSEAKLIGAEYLFAERRNRASATYIDNVVLLCAFFQKIVYTERVGVQYFQKDLHPLDLGAKRRRKGEGRWLMAADVIHHSS